MRLLDTFPAIVHITPSDTYPQLDLEEINIHESSSVRGSKFLPISRVIATTDTIHIAVDSSTGPVTFFREKYISMKTDQHKITRFITVTNKIIAVKKDNSCGCGSRLKNWSPVGNILTAD